MKLTVFDANDGDCLLLTSKDRAPIRMLIDGGRTTSWVAHTRAAVAELGKLDVVCVSHIDDDHITGILRLVEDEVAWRAFEFHQTLDAATAAPGFPRPPKIGEVWHNGLFRLVGDDTAPEVEVVLANVATVLAGSTDDELRDLAARLDDLATGEKASMELSRRLSLEQLDIPLNPRSQGELMKRGAAADVTNLGSLRLHLLGPTQGDIDELRVEWKKWLGKNKRALRELQGRMLADEERMGTPAIDTALGDGLSGVTEANVASLMFLVEEGNASILLTGDGTSSKILDGLRHHGKLDARGRIHVGVLKVQHHGAKANVTKEFVKSVTADHYVFCGNGAHHNPEREVVEQLAAARLTGIDGEPPVGPDAPFEFWFTSASTTPGLTASRKAHMKKIEGVVARLRAADPRLTSTFLEGGSFEIAL